MLHCREIPQGATTTDIPSHKAGIGKDVLKHLSSLFVADFMRIIIYV